MNDAEHDSSCRFVLGGLICLGRIDLIWRLSKRDHHPWDWSSILSTVDMSDLSSLRKRIDDLDNTLVELLNERAQVSLNIGAAKRKATDR